MSSAAMQKWRAAHVRRVTRGLVDHLPRFDARIADPRARVRAAMTLARGVRTRLPIQVPPRTLEVAYGTALLTYVDIAKRALQPLLDRLPRLVEQAAASAAREDGTRMDATAAEAIRQLIEDARRRIAAAVNAGGVEDLAARFAQQTSTYQRIQLVRQLRAGLGADPFIQDRALQPLADAFVEANVGLIRDLTDGVARDIEDVTMNGILDGRLHGDIARDISERFGISERRARLIGRDQVGKFYGQVNAARQRNLGVEQFIWRTVGDERVRDEHVERDGQTYDYADPPDGELPGEPINCRCYAEPILGMLTGDGDDDAPDENVDDPDEGGGILASLTRPSGATDLGDRDSGGVPRSGARITEADEYKVQEVNASSILARGYFQFSDLSESKLKGAREIVGGGKWREGWRDAIKIIVHENGDLEVDDGRHRMAAAIEQNAKVKVRFLKGGAGVTRTPDTQHINPSRLPAATRK